MLTIVRGVSRCTSRGCRWFNTNVRAHASCSSSSPWGWLDSALQQSQPVLLAACARGGRLRGNRRAAALLQTPASSRGASSRITRIRLSAIGVPRWLRVFIVLSTAVHVEAAGRTHIETSAHQPRYFDLSQVLRSALHLGIIARGGSPVPVLAGSAAYAVADFLSWQQCRVKSVSKGTVRTEDCRCDLAPVADSTPIDPIRRFSGAR